MKIHWARRDIFEAALYVLLECSSDNKLLFFCRMHTHLRSCCHHTYSTSDGEPTALVQDMHVGLFCLIWWYKGRRVSVHASAATLLAAPGAVLLFCRMYTEVRCMLLRLKGKQGEKNCHHPCCSCDSHSAALLRDTYIPQAAVMSYSGTMGQQAYTVQARLNCLYGNLMLFCRMHSLFWTEIIGSQWCKGQERYCNLGCYHPYCSSDSKLAASL